MKVTTKTLGLLFFVALGGAAIALGGAHLMGYFGKTVIIQEQSVPPVHRTNLGTTSAAIPLIPKFLMSAILYLLILMCSNSLSITFSLSLNVTSIYLILSFLLDVCKFYCYISSSGIVVITTCSYGNIL